MTHDFHTPQTRAARRRRFLPRAEEVLRSQGVDRPPWSPAEVAEPGQNPLHTDGELFYEYMRLLDDVLAQPEIRLGLLDQNLTATRIRMMCVARADEVLREAVAEYAAYAEALAGYRQALAEVRLTGDRDAGDRTLRRFSVFLWSAGVAGVVLGLAGGHWWRTVAFFWKPGLAALAVGGLGFALVLLRRSEPGVRRLGGEIAGARGGDLDRARRRLLDTLRAQHLLPFVRTLINNERRSALGEDFAVTASPGLSEVYDSAYHVPTELTERMEGLIGRLAGGSVGVAGQRGSGKSTLVRGFCEDTGRGSGDLRCMVSAPVDYAARDFILHLFAMFCRGVRAQVGHRRGDSGDTTMLMVWGEALLDVPLSAWFWAGLAVLVFRDRVADPLHLPAPFVGYAALVVIGHGILGAAWRAETDRRLDWRASLPAVWLGAVLAVARSALRWGAAGATLLYFRHDIARRLGRPPHDVRYAAWAVFAAGALGVAWAVFRERRYALRSRALGRRRLRRAAGRNLQRVRYLQTSTTGWTRGIKLPFGGAFGVEGQRTRGVSRAEQPMSYPEIVEEFRVFARNVADFLHEDGERVFIGVDELDKIGSAEQAERFLNEIKGVFGIPHTYFLISVSDDALTSFERRGLPLRDAFDSSFDEIIRADPLTYAESRRLVYRRVIGLTEPYIAFCHCLSGGLARDLIRAARQVVRVGQQDTPQGPPGFGEICTTILGEEVRRKLNAATQVIAAAEGAERAGPLLERLFAVTHRPSGVRATLALVEEIGTAAPEGSARVAALHRDLTAYLYFCATLQDIFGRRVEEPKLLWATADGDRHAGHFDTLAAAGLTLGHSAHVAWRLIDDLRDAWSLAPVEGASLRRRSPWRPHRRWRVPIRRSPGWSRPE